MANLIERTTTEEYDEDGRLTSRTTVEKYGDDGPVLPKNFENVEIENEDFYKAVIEELNSDAYKLWKTCRAAAIMCNLNISDG